METPSLETIYNNLNEINKVMTKIERVTQEKMSTLQTSVDDLAELKRCCSQLHKLK